MCKSLVEGSSAYMAYPLRVGLLGRSNVECRVGHDGVSRMAKPRFTDAQVERQM